MDDPPVFLFSIGSPLVVEEIKVLLIGGPHVYYLECICRVSPHGMTNPRAAVSCSLANVNTEPGKLTLSVLNKKSPTKYETYYYRFGFMFVSLISMSISIRYLHIKLLQNNILTIKLLLKFTGWCLRPFLASKANPPSPSAFQANPGPTERVFGNPPVQGRSFEMPWRPSKTWGLKRQNFFVTWEPEKWMTPMSRFLPHKSVPYWHRKSQPRHRGLGKTVVSGGFVFDWFWLLEMEKPTAKKLSLNDFDYIICCNYPSSTLALDVFRPHLSPIPWRRLS